MRKKSDAKKSMERHLIHAIMDMGTESLSPEGWDKLCEALRLLEKSRTLDAVDTFTSGTSKRRLRKSSITIEEAVDKDLYCPLPLGVFPNQMGINLCSVESVAWEKQEDDQLVTLSVVFKPSND